MLLRETERVCIVGVYTQHTQTPSILVGAYTQHARVLSVLVGVYTQPSLTHLLAWVRLDCRRSPTIRLTSLEIPAAPAVPTCITKINECILAKHKQGYYRTEWPGSTVAFCLVPDNSNLCTSGSTAYRVATGFWQHCRHCCC